MNHYKFVPALLRSAFLLLALLGPLRADQILRTLTPQRALEGQEPVVRSVASPDGKLVAIQLKSGAIRVVDMEKKLTLRTIPRLGDATGALAVAGDVLVAGVGKAVFVVDLAKQDAPRQIFKGGSSVYRVAFFPLRQLVAIGSGEGLRVLNLTTGDTVFSNQDQPCLGVAFSPDGQTMAAVQGKMVTVYGLPNVIEQWKTAASFFPAALAYAQDGATLAFAGDSNVIQVNKVKDGTFLQRLNLGFATSKVLHLALTPDGKGLVAASERKVHIFDAIAGTDPARKDVKLDEKINGLLLSASAQSLLVSCEDTAFLQTFPTTMKLPDHLLVDFKPKPQLHVFQPAVTILSPSAQDTIAGPTVQVLARVLTAPDQRLQSLKVLVDGRELELAGTVAPKETPLPAGAPPLKDGEELYHFVVPIPPQNCTVALLGETLYATSRLAALKIKREAPPVVIEKPQPRLQVVPPELAILQPLADTLVQGEAIQLILKARALPDQKIQSIQILVDGQPVEAVGGIRPKAVAASLGAGVLQEDEELLLYSVPVPNRDCVVAVFAESRFANSTPATVRLRREPPPVVVPPPPPTIAIVRPQVDILSPRTEEIAKFDVVNLMVRITASPQQKVAKLQVQVDGQSVAVMGAGPSSAPTPVAGPAGQSGAAPADARAEEIRQISVPIPSRHCTITVWAETAYANSELATLRVRREEVAPPPPAALARPEMPSIVPPSVTIITPSNEAEVKDESVPLKVKLRYSAMQKLTGVRVLIDGVAIPLASLRGVRPQQDAAVPTVVASAAAAPAPGGPQQPHAAPAMLEEIQDFNIPIPSKDCTIAVIAETAMANSDLATVKLRFKARHRIDVNGLPRLYILAVGVSDYQDAALKLTYPAKDAGDFTRTIGDQKGKLYKDVLMTVLTNDKATRDNIMDGLEWLQRQVTQADVAVLFFAGHGMNDPATGQFYYLPYNANLNAIKRTMVANTDIMSTLDSLAGKRLLFIDSCNSANVSGKNKLRGAMDIAQIRKEFESAGQGAAVFAAASGKQGAQENETWGNGAFTKAILEALDGRADTRKTGRITITMLNAYITERVKELTSGFQTPIFKSQDDLGDFPLTLLGTPE